MSKLKELLNTFLETEGARVALVVDRDGFVIEGVARAGDTGLDPIGAAISTSLSSIRAIGRELQVGGVNLAMLEFDKGTVLVRVLGELRILAILVDSSANLGLPRHQIRKLAAELDATLV